MIITYKLFANPFGPPNLVDRSDGLVIPFVPSNTDYQQFKIDVASGVELQDSDGIVMSQEQVDEFLKTIP